MSASSFIFKPLSESDAPLLAEWLLRPHVAEWWKSTGSFEDVLAEVRRDFMSQHQESPGDRSYLACLNGEPVGYLHSYVAAASTDGWWPDECDPGVLGIDQFLADGAGLDQGIGTRMIAAFVALLFRDPRVTRIQTDPAPDNRRAIRCYEKVGFRRVGSVTTPDGAAILMVIDRPFSASV